MTAAGGQVHWAADAQEARRIILEICRKAQAKRITKGKSMVSEEIGLNEALIDDGYEVVETDLGEYIIQLAEEPPSHIIAPAVHKTKRQVSDLFEQHHHLPRKETVSELVGEARQMLREKYFTAEVGITGGNFLVAETGSSVIVTNEGNGDLTQTLARVHIVTSGIIISCVIIFTGSEELLFRRGSRPSSSDVGREASATCVRGSSVDRVAKSCGT